jgi:hypothetical protein
MKKVLFGWMMILSVLMLGLTSCKKDDKAKDDELSKDIQNFVSEETLQQLTDLDMEINKGMTPPDMEGTYVATPFEMIATSIEDDYYPVGSIFSDYYFRLYDQNNDDMTIKIDYENGGETGSGMGGFISGSGDKFSVFIEVDCDYEGSKATVLQVISGTITDDGIKGFHFANWMLDNNGNESGYYIDEETGRVFIDSDKVTELTDYNFKSTKSTVNSVLPGAARIK